MSRIASAVGRHPLGAYFLLTYAVSWTAWKSFDRLYLAGEIVAVPFIVLGIFGPGLVSLSLSALGAPEPRQKGSGVLAFALAWPAATAVIALHLLLANGRTVSIPTFAVSAVSGLMPAAVLGAAFGSVPGPRRHLCSLVKPRGQARYYVLAVVLFGGIWSLGVALSRAFGVSVPQRFLPSEAVRVGLVGGVALQFFYNFLLNGLSEEVGWRGFALPRLQARHSPLAASIILWAFWAVWHLPAYRRGFAPQSLENTIVELVLLLPVAIVFTWFYNRAKGGLLVVAILHPAMNTATHYLPVTVGGIVLLLTCMVAAVVSDRMWRAPGTTAPETTA